MSEQWQQVGVVGVDAGLIWIGDPCYCVTPDANEHPAKTWSEFCNKLPEGHVPHQWNYQAGHAGLGVSVPSGYGDGTYPVLVRRNSEGIVVEAKVMFDWEDGEEYEAG